VRDLAKLDLDPNTVYNVSLSVAQGTKKFDNLRFFQTKTPKLFNLIPGQYSTFSRLTTAMLPVIPKIGGGTYNPAELQTIDIVSVSWVTVWKYDRSEGQTTKNIDGSTVTFTIKLASAPPTFVFKVSGFNSKLSCLNNRSDWEKVSSTTYSVTTSVREFDPNMVVISDWVFDRNKTVTARFAVKKGATVIFTNQQPVDVIDNRSVLQGSVRSGKKYVQIFSQNTRMVGRNNIAAPYYIVSGTPTQVGFGKDTAISVGRYDWVSTANWTGGRTDKENGEGTNATLQYYSSPSYSPITTTYSFTGSSSVTSEVLNSTVLDALIWEPTIRDFIYFFISDTAGGLNTSPTWYYFDNRSSNGGITAADLTGRRISGVPLSIASGSGDDRVLNPPPPAPGFVENVSLNPSYPAIALKARTTFYNISKTNKVNDASQPALNYPVSIRFAIARYVKSDTGWSRSWLGSDNRMKNVLSLEEALS
jgi:hypothetical protein